MAGPAGQFFPGASWRLARPQAALNSAWEKRLTSGTSAPGAKPREHLFRRLAGHLKVEGVSTELDLVVPRDSTVWGEMDPLEDSAMVPGPEYAPSREIRQVDFARGPVGEPEPDPQPLTRFDFQRSDQ